MTTQLTVRLIAASDSGHMLDLVADVIVKQGLKVFKPTGWYSDGLPLYHVDMEPATDFAVALLTPRYVEAIAKQDLWLRALTTSVKDVMYVWGNVVPLVDGPWNKPGASAAVITHMTKSEAQATLREGLERLVRTCDRCGKLCRAESVLYIDGRTGEVTQKLCGECVWKERIAEYEQTKTIGTALMREGFSSMHSEFVSFPPGMWLELNHGLSRVQSTIKRFETLVWFGAGVQKYYQEATVRGHCLKVSDEVSVLLWGTAGRVMITFQKESGEFVTVLCIEDSTTSTMNLEGINATVEEALSLVNGSILAIQQGGRFQPDTDVTHLVVAMSRQNADE